MKVFLSYVPSDREVAKELAGLLEKAGHDVWFADDALFPGENWASQIGKALKESGAMVVLISPLAMKSGSVRQEIEFALGASQFRGRLIPVMVKATPDIPWILKKLPIVRFDKRITEVSREIVDYVEHGFELTPARA
jgi:hypothetical protein